MELANAIDLPLRPVVKENTMLTMLSVNDEDSNSEYSEVDTNKGPHETILLYQGFVEIVAKFELNLDAFSHKVQKLGSALELSIAARSLSTVLRRLRKHTERAIDALKGHPVKNTQVNASVVTPETPRYKGRFDWEMPRDEEKGAEDVLQEVFSTMPKALKKLSDAIQDFQDYIDSEGEESTQKFIEHVEFVSDCINRFKAENGCDSTDLQRFIEEMAIKMRAHISATTDMLDRFIDIGIPCISSAQQRSATILLNAATVATFFAGVAATTLQFSVGDNGSPLKIAGNSLWFASLALSIGSAVNSLLAMTWRQAVFSSPNQRLPSYIRFWTRQGPLALLITSTLSFLGGLLCYVLATQDKATFWMSLSCIAFFAIGLTTVSIYFAFERWKFSRFRNSLHINTKNNDSTVHHIQKLLRKFTNITEANALPVFRTRDSSDTESVETMLKSAPVPSSTKCGKTLNATASKPRGRAHSRQTRMDNVHDMDSNRNGNISPPRIRPVNAPSSMHRHPLHATTTSSNRRADTVNIDYVSACAKAISDAVCQRVTIGLPDLKSQKNTRVLVANHNECIVTCCYSRCAFFKLDVSSGLQFCHYLEDPVQQSPRRITRMQWSPSGTQLMMGMKRGMTLWTMNASRSQMDRQRTFLRKLELRDFRWVNDDVLLALLKDGQTLEGIARVEVSKQPSREADVFTLFSLPDGFSVRSLHPLTEDRIILVAEMSPISILAIGKFVNNPKHSARDQSYKHDTQTNGSVDVYQQVPVSGLIQTLSLSNNRRSVLVGFKEKAPELWQVGDDSVNRIMSNDDPYLKFLNGMSWEQKSSDAASGQELQQSHWGEAMFSGVIDSLIVCPVDDYMHFWDSKSGRLLNSVRRPDSDHTNKNEYNGKDNIQDARYAWLKLHGIPQIAVATSLNQRLDMHVWYSRDSLQKSNQQMHIERSDTPLSVVFRREDSPRQHSEWDNSAPNLPQHPRHFRQARLSRSTINIEIIPPDDDSMYDEYEESDTESTSTEH